MKKLLELYDEELPIVYLTQFCEVPPWKLNLPTIHKECAKFKKSETNPATYQHEFLQLINKYPKSLNIHTDGSKTANGTSSAFYTNGQSYFWKIHAVASIFIQLNSRPFEIKTKENLTYAEAKKKVSVPTPTAGVSFARAVATNPNLLDSADLVGELLTNLSSIIEDAVATEISTLSLTKPPIPRLKEGEPNNFRGKKPLTEAQAQKYLILNLCHPYLLRKRRNEDGQRKNLGNLRPNRVYLYNNT
ncbi:hypothetical protein JTB14_037458 [Gonioctena quinquepunctata]|nr:hypothetical protein JTB14_037458 [Gonioctena quinquepunctata]